MFYVLCTGVHSMLSRDGLSAGAGFGRLRFSLRGGCCCSPFPLSKRSVNHGHGARAPSFVSVEFVSFGSGPTPELRRSSSSIYSFLVLSGVRWSRWAEFV